jgi:hypothetical protein
MYNYIYKYFSSEKKEKYNKDNLQLIKKHNKYFNSIEKDIAFFTLNRLKKNANLKHIFFSNKSKLDNLDLFFNIKTNIYYLNKNLVYPNTLLIADMDEEEKENAKLKLNLNDDLSLRYSKNKTERLLYLRKKAKKLIKQKKKFKKIKKKIRIFGEDEIEDFKEVEEVEDFEEVEEVEDFELFIRNKNIINNIIAVNEIKNVKKNIVKVEEESNFSPFVIFKSIILKLINDEDSSEFNQLINQFESKNSKKNEGQYQKEVKIIKDEFGKIIKKVEIKNNNFFYKKNNFIKFPNEKHAYLTKK